MKKYLYLITAMIMMLIPMTVSASTQSDYVDGRVNEIIKELNITSTDTYHKVLAINDYMYDNFEFTRTYTPDSAYSLLKSGGANCQGWCQLFIELTKKVGIESAMVYQDYMDHRWNVVKMDDGKYYFADAASERYASMRHYRFLKGTKGFYYTMNSTFKYDVSETDYRYVPKTEEPKEPVVTPSEPTTEGKPETKPVVDPKPEVKPTEPTTEQKPETTPTKPSTSTGNNGANGLFYFSKSVPSLSNIKQIGITIGKEIGSKIKFNFNAK